jgi:hypothetical protein
MNQARNFFIRNDLTSNIRVSLKSSCPGMPPKNAQTQSGEDERFSKKCIIFECLFQFSVQSFKQVIMKTKKFFPVLTFLAGLLTGGILLAILAFASPAPPPAEITPAQARTYFSRYFQNPDNVTGMRGYAIDLGQFNAMQQILLNDPTVKGFRVYKGIDDAQVRIGMVIGIDANGSESAQDKIYKSNSTYLGPCPTICDSLHPLY